MEAKRILGALALLLPLVPASALPAQNTAPAKPGPKMTFVNVTVRGAKNATAAGLKREHFQVREDGKEQQISFFSPDDTPWSIGIIIGVEGFLPGRADQTSSSIRDAVQTFQKSGNPNNKYWIDELPFGSDGVYHAVSRGLERLEQDPNPRRALLLITNGFDTTDGDPGHPLIEYAKKLSNVPIQLIFLRGAAPESPTLSEVARGNQYWLNGGRVWEELTNVTGGHMYTSEPIHEMGPLCVRIANELRGQYIIGYTSINDTKQGTWRKLQVKITGPKEMPKLKVEHKSRYFAPKVDTPAGSNKD